MNCLSLSDNEAGLLISKTITDLKAAAGTAEAVVKIGTALSRYTVFDLQYIGGCICREAAKLPNPYQRAYLPYSTDLLDQHHRFITMYRTLNFADVPRKNPELWRKYWEIARTVYLVRTRKTDDPFPQMEHPLSEFFYRLVYGYVMLIEGGCGHPIGLPFPGGATVRQEGHRVLCPIRDKEKDLPSALCNFCPAEQDPDYR